MLVTFQINSNPFFICYVKRKEANQLQSKFHLSFLEMTTGLEKERARWEMSNSIKLAKTFLRFFFENVLKHSKKF
jgi:hypothetical protein